MKSTCIILALLCSVLSFSATADSQHDVLAALQSIRGTAVTQDMQATKQANNALDAAWKTLTVDKTIALPIIRKQYQDELKVSSPNQFFLLDVGYYLYTQGEPSDKTVAWTGLLKVDAGAPIVRANSTELFQFAYAAAKDHQPGMTGFIDRAFLPTQAHAFVPQHALDLDPTLQCVFLYGLQGPDIESHLDGLLKQGSQTIRVLEILNWLGSSSSVPVALVRLQAHPGKDEFDRLVGYFMRVGGPDGKKALLSVDLSAAPPESHDEFAKIKSKAQSLNYQGFLNGLASMGPGERLTDAVMRARLKTMVANYGRDDTLAPATILYSTVPTSELLPQMLAIRSSMFNRLSDEALSDVEITNVVINALQYRDAP